MKPIYDPKTFRLREGFGFLIGRVRKAAIEKIEQELAPLDLTGAQWIVILLMVEESAATPADLSKWMSYDPGAMTRVLDRLEEKGLLRRTRAAGDRRCVHLELTAEGQTLYPRIRETYVRVSNHLLQGFTKSEVQELAGFLNRLLTNAESAPPA